MKIDAANERAAELMANPADQSVLMTLNQLSAADPVRIAVATGYEIDIDHVRESLARLQEGGFVFAQPYQSGHDTYTVYGITGDGREIARSLR